MDAEPKSQSIAYLFKVLKDAPRCFGERALSKRSATKSGDFYKLSALNNVINSFDQATVPPVTPGRLLQAFRAQLGPIPKVSDGDRLVWISRCSGQFMTAMSDAFSVLLLEPLFAGQWRPSLHELNLVDLQIRGAGHWFKEVFLARQLRELAPRGEMLAGSQESTVGYFHAYRAFDGYDVGNFTRSLKYYVDAFSAQRRDSPARAFNTQFDKYYELPIKAKTSPFDRLKRYGILDELQGRFFLVKGLPSIISGWTEGGKDTRRWEKFYFDLFKDGLFVFGNLDEALLNRVRCRRAIQNRAYLALSIKSVLRRGAFQSTKEFNSSQTLTSLERYLDLLEKAIACLAAGASIVAVKKQYRAADRFYAAKIQTELLRDKVRATYRRLPSDSQARRIAVQKRVLARLDFMGDPKLALSLLSEIEANGGKSSTSESTYKHDLILDMWSLPLAATSPSKEEFMDPLVWDKIT